jgi:hypothetical protein
VRIKICECIAFLRKNDFWRLNESAVLAWALTDTADTPNKHFLQIRAVSQPTPEGDEKAWEQP